MSDLIEAIQALEKLEYQQQRLQKMALLEKYVNNPVLQMILKIALSPDRYYCNPDANLLSTSLLQPQESWEQFLVLVQKLRNRELAGTDAYRQTNAFLASCKPLYMKWFCRAIKQDLRIGVGKDTVACIWGPDFLQSYDPQSDRWKFLGCSLFKLYDDVYRNKKIRFPVGVEPNPTAPRALTFCFPAEGRICICNIDGVRLEKVEAVESYADQLLTLCQQLNQGSGNRPIVLDGVFLQHNGKSARHIVHKTKTFDPQAFLDNINMALFDWSPLDCYHAGQFSVPWIRRKAELMRAAGANQPSADLIVHSNNVTVFGHALVYDHNQLNKQAMCYKNEGYTVVLVKMPDAPLVFRETEFSAILRS